MGANGVTTWFQQDLRVQRKGLVPATSRGFLAVAPESMVLEPGDVIHVDFGITTMGFSTDWQKEAYLLRPGETDAPAGLKVGLEVSRVSNATHTKTRQRPTLMSVSTGVAGS